MPANALQEQVVGDQSDISLQRGLFGHNSYVMYRWEWTQLKHNTSDGHKSKLNLVK